MKISDWAYIRVWVFLSTCLEWKTIEWYSYIYACAWSDVVVLWSFRSWCKEGRRYNQHSVPLSILCPAYHGGYLFTRLWTIQVADFKFMCYIFQYINNLNEERYFKQFELVCILIIAVRSSQVVNNKYNMKPTAIFIWEVFLVKSNEKES